MKKSAYYLFTLLASIAFANPANAQAPVNDKTNIDLSNWKVTLPFGNPDPKEIDGVGMSEFNKNPEVNKYMYYDDIDGGLVFFAKPGATTRNTSYARCELREQLISGDDSTNWTFEEGGIMKGTLKIEDISKNAKGKFDKVIVMQIHGRLSTEDRVKIGKKDNDAPPILKVYWYNGNIRLISKVLRKGKSGKDIFYKDSWMDAEPYVFPVNVGFNKFSLEIIAEKNKLSVILNDKHTKVFDSKDIKKWSVFENYFKAGNYLGTRADDGFAKVKYYDLEVTH